MSESKDSHDDNKYRLWGGRFEAGTDSLMKIFNESLPVDKRLWREDITGSKAWAKAITNVKLLTESELEQIISGLDQIYKEWETGTFVIKPNDEDIHTANERRLKELIGDVAMKLHTGRSRNDQVVTDMRLWLAENSKVLENNIIEFIQTCLKRAESDIDVIMPGYTHLQRAQPIRFSHLILSYVCAIDRDFERLKQAQKRINVCPLGSGAIAGNPFEVNRELLAKSLNFEHATYNSIDSIETRDFIHEFLYICSSIAINLSKFAEDFIIYNSKEFSFIQLSDKYSTGSSLMPQKKNPDSLELIRGKAGTVLGRLNGFLITLKGLPTSYNKDLQEDKETMFDVFDTVNLLVRISEGVIRTLTVNKDKMLSALSFDLLATDLAYYLVRKKIPFRQAHSYAGQCVALAEKSGRNINELELSELKSICDSFDTDIKDLYNFEKSVEQYKSVGGTAKQSVQTQINHFKKIYNLN